MLMLKRNRLSPAFFLFLVFLIFTASGQANFLDDLIPWHAKPKIKEADGSRVECHVDMGLENWGENVRFHPKYVFVPQTKEGICNIVKWAAEQTLRIRVSGYRHTWNPVFADDGHILISLLGLEYVDSNKASYVVDGETGAGKELRQIAYVLGSVEEDKIFCKVGGAVTNDELRDFCLKTPDPFSNQFWSIPSNVILVENTFSGTISSMCHGGGCQHKTLSDLVEEIEFVNAQGNIQVISKADQPELMKAAAGSFGLLGVITSITLKLDKMGYALTDPKLVSLAKAIPPPYGTRLEDMPKKLQRDLALADQASLDRVIAKNSEIFFERCKDYYSEWFWFILTDKCWVNTWNKDDPSNDAKNRENWDNWAEKIYHDLEGWLQTSMSSFVELFNTSKRTMPAFLYQEYFVRCRNDVIIGALSSTRHTLPVPEALHFQQGIRHFRVRDVEMEIPIPLKEDGQPDWTVCQQAWWDAIDVIYSHLEKTGTLPVNLTLEMRIMGGSDVTMAAQRHNIHTCSIEVLSTMVVPHKEWKMLSEQIIARWLKFKNVRTHWAKEWYGLQFNGVEGLSFVKQTHSEATLEFKAQLSQIAHEGGYTLEEMQKRFSNRLLDELFFE